WEWGGRCADRTCELLGSLGKSVYVRGVPPDFAVARRFSARVHRKGHGFCVGPTAAGGGCPSYAPLSPRGEFTGPAATGPRGRLWAGGVRNAARETAPTPKSETWVLR